MGGAEKVAQFLSSNIPKDFLLSVDAHFRSAVERGTAAGEFADPGHRSTVIGCNRHYALNEALDLTFNEFNVPHLPLRGNVIVAGQLGRVTVARFHKNKGLWDNSRRSAGKLKLCKKNTGVETLVQPDFLEVDRPSPSEMTCFLVTEHNGEPREMCEVHLVVPDSRMDLKNLLFSEPLGLFLQRYEKIAEVRDIAVPRLKPGVLRKPGDSAGHE